VFLLELFGARGLELGFERTNLALEGAHGVDRLVDLVEQTLLLAVGVLELANDARDKDVLAAHEPEILAREFGLGLGVLALRIERLGEVVGGLLLVLDELVGTSNRSFYTSCQ